MLQIAERGSGAKRKALLMQEASPVEEVDDYTQRQFSGTAFDRMRADPDVLKAEKSLLFGASLVASFIVVAIAVSLMTSWTQSSEIVGVRAREVEENLVIPVTIAKQSLSPMLSRPMDFEQIVKKRRSQIHGGSHESGGE